MSDGFKFEKSVFILAYVQVRRYGAFLFRRLGYWHLTTATVRPEFTGTLAIKSGRHPILEIVQAAGTVVSNDVYCDNSSTFQIIQGPKYVITIPVPMFKSDTGWHSMSGRRY